MTAQYVPKTILVSITNIQVHALWNDSSNPSDPWINFPYQWQITAAVKSQVHSDPYTPRPYTYNGLDVSIGDWLGFTSPRSLVLEIVSIISQTDSQLNIIVEDVDRYNLYNDQTQNGIAIGNPSQPGIYDCVIVSIGNDGQLSFANIPDYTVPISLLVETNNRFQFRNEVQDYIKIYQVGNGFAVGNPITLSNDGIYRLSQGNTSVVQHTVGVVTAINEPGAGWFNYRPIGRLISNLPTLPGSVGDILYVSSDTPGLLTANKPTPNSKPIYIKVDSQSAILINTSPQNTADLGDVNTTGLQDGNVLVYQAATHSWIPGVATGGSGNVNVFVNGGYYT